MEHYSARMQQTSLKQARQSKRLTVAALAKRVGVNKSTVSRIERRLVRPLHDTVVALEKALELEPGSLKA